MSISEDFLTSDDLHPIDIVETLAEHHAWEFDRVTDDQIARLKQWLLAMRARLLQFLDRFEAHMQGRDWVATDAFSLADITAGVALDFAGWIKVDVNDGRPAIAAWRGRLAQRASFAL